MTRLPSADDVLHFWFQELEAKDWFVANPTVDEMIRLRFEPLLKSAAQSELFEWRTSAKHRLAEVIVLDQFSRNIYRNSAQAFAQDPLALALAQQAIELKLDQDLNLTERSFLYMPFMHSESKLIHQLAVDLFNIAGMENNYQFELKHKVIIDRFGRYPHRNDILGRASTAEEIEFLTQPDSSF